MDSHKYLVFSTLLAFLSIFVLVAVTDLKGSQSFVENLLVALVIVTLPVFGSYFAIKGFWYEKWKVIAGLLLPLNLYRYYSDILTFRD